MVFFCLGMTSAQEASFDLSPGDRWPRETGAEQGIAGIVLTGAERGSSWWGGGGGMCPGLGGHADARFLH